MSRNKNLAILTPVFNDWLAVESLIQDIDKHVPDWGYESVSIFVLNDGSLAEFESAGLIDRLKHIVSLEVLEMTCNLGHQRSIAVGLCALDRRKCYGAVLVMDCDGEDRPSDVSKLIKAQADKEDAVIVAQRKIRSEGILFQLFYWVYKKIFELLTGRDIDFGNFCLIPARILSHICYMPELWNHLAATIIRSQMQIIRVPTRRGHRYAGKSSMSFVSLVTHGLSAVSVFTDRLFVRLLVVTGLTSVVAVVSATIIIGIKSLTDLAIPGWASILVSLSLVVLIQSITLLIVGVIMMLSTRSTLSFIPALHTAIYIKNKPMNLLLDKPVEC